MQRNDRLRPLGMWRRVECINAKRPAASRG